MAETPPTPPTPSQRVPVSIQDEMRTSYLDYAMSVIIGRAIPDVRDGLKPVHRRILFSRTSRRSCPGRRTRSARASSATCSASTTRTATSGLRRAGPHGAGLLDALPAHRRAGQLRLGRRRPGRRLPLHRGAPLASSPSSSCADLDKETVDFVPNYDDSELEPSVLPARVPAAPRQRVGRHRRRHGDQHPAAQPGRDHRRHDRPHPEPRAHASTS